MLEGRNQGRFSGEYAVHRIAEERVAADGDPEYLVVWAGYPHPEDFDWNPRMTVLGTKALEDWENLKESNLKQSVAH